MVQCPKKMNGSETVPKRFGSDSPFLFQLKGMRALVDVDLLQLVESGHVYLLEEGKENHGKLKRLIQPASIDLPIGGTCYLMRDKVLPHRRSIRSILNEKDCFLEKVTIEAANDSVLLLKGQTYLFPCVKLDLGGNLRGSLSPKSSIGRVDLMVRGIFDECGLYDTVAGKGELWLEVSPRSFNVRVHSLQTLSQLMIFTTDAPSQVDSPLSINSMMEMPLCYDRYGEPIVEEAQIHRGALVLSLNLMKGKTDSACDDVLGYEALPTSKVIDLNCVATHDATEFFRPIPCNHAVTLEKDKFYILATKEKVSIPVHLSAEMVPFSQHVGELRAHYAGFFDPGFGFGENGEIKGTVGVLEVRPHETVTVYDGQPICLMEFYRNTRIPLKEYGMKNNNNYQQQEGPKLAKYFM